MKIDYNILLDWVPREVDREELSNLSKELFETELTRQTADPAGRSAADARSNELIDQLTQAIERQFRKMRRPMPTREEIIEMVKEHFGGQSNDT